MKINNKIYIEKLHKNIGQFFNIDYIIYKKKTKFQNILIFYNSLLGKILSLNNIIQSTEYDEFIYHEMITLIPIYSHPNPKKILIIGGGDCGCIREIIKFKNIKSITLVEIDKEVLKCSKKYLFKHHKNSFKDKRVKIIINDGYSFLKKNKKKFDILIIDGTDPVGYGKNLYSKKFYKKCKNSLNSNGILITQSGTYMLQIKEAINHYLNIKKIFKYSGFYQASIPTYYGGNMLFIWSSNKINLYNTNEHILNKKIDNLDFKYYNFLIHKSSFILPQYFIKKLNYINNGEKNCKK